MKNKQRCNTYLYICLTSAHLMSASGWGTWVKACSRPFVCSAAHTAYYRFPASTVQTCRKKGYWLESTREMKEREEHFKYRLEPKCMPQIDSFHCSYWKNYPNSLFTYRVKARSALTVQNLTYNAALLGLMCTALHTTPTDIWSYIRAPLTCTNSH